MNKKQYIAPLIVAVKLDTQNLLSSSGMEEGKGDGGGPTAKRKKGFIDFTDADEF